MNWIDRFYLMKMRVEPTGVGDYIKMGGDKLGDNNS